MNTDKLLIDKSHLQFLIEGRKDNLGKTSYVVTSSIGKIRFRNMDSVLDFLSMNNDLGYVNGK